MPHFERTSHTLVHRAAVLREPLAIEQLRKNYRKPLLACVRAQYPKLSLQDAEQQVDSVFTEFTDDKRQFAFDPDKGRFRTYLFGAVKNRINTALRAANALKRGGEFEHLPLEASAEISDASGDEMFLREWARHILARANERTLDGRDADEAALFPYLTDPSPDFNALGIRFGITPSAVRKRLEKLIAEFRGHLRDAVRDDLFSPTESAVDSDLRLLRHYFFS
jgi:RNA polymerase sigma-70 factor (ECF subfamily)